MTRTLPPELAGLPKPATVETISVDTILDGKIARLLGNYATAGLSYTVEKTQYDPQVIQLQAASNDEARLRQRVNEAFQAQLLVFATKSDLDVVAADYGVYRLPGEDDDRLAQRVVLKNADRNSAGTDVRYQFRAMTASLRVKDAVVYTVGRDPTIRIALLSTDNNGVADQTLINQVKAATNLKMANDTIVVEAAVRIVLVVEADVWLLPDAPIAATLAAAEASLRAAWASDGKLGRDWDSTYATKHLMVPGVQRLDGVSPAGPTVVPYNQLASIGAVILTFRGRAY